MPIIRKEQVYITKGVKVDRVLKYSTAEKVFSMQLPEFIAESTGKAIISASSQAEVEKLWDTTIKGYYEAEKTERKVIVFSCSLQVKEPLNGVITDANLNWGNNLNQWDMYYNTLENGFRASRYATGLQLGFGVYTETFHMGRYNWKRLSGDDYDDYALNMTKTGNTHSRKPELKVIDHTPEREEFFMKLRKNMVSLIRKVSEGLEKLTNEELTAKIDSGGFKLLN